jgi:hypothetical protein
MCTQLAVSDANAPESTTSPHFWGGCAAVSQRARRRARGGGRQRTWNSRSTVAVSSGAKPNTVTQTSQFQSSAAPAPSCAPSCVRRDAPQTRAARSAFQACAAAHPRGRGLRRSRAVVVPRRGSACAQGGADRRAQRRCARELLHHGASACSDAVAARSVARAQPRLRPPTAARRPAQTAR